MTSCNETMNATHYPCNDYTKYAEYIVGMYLWKVLTPIIIIIGNVGNVLSIIILNRKSIRRSVCTVYFTTLAISDILSLNTGLLRNWIYYSFETDIRESSTPVCKIHIFLVYFALDLSAWMLVIVTIERVGRVFFHTRSKVFCSKKNSFLIVLILVMVLFCYNAHLLIGNGNVINVIGNETIVETCGYTSDEYKYFFNTLWPWMDFATFCAVPSIILLTGNVSIVGKVIQSKRRVAAMMSVQASATQRNDAKITSMTAMLVTLNTVFLFSTAPISAYIICYNDWYQYPTAHDVAIDSLVWPVLYILMYMNNALNFGLYVLSGKRFRIEAAKLFSSNYHQSNVVRVELQEARRVVSDNVRRIQVQPIPDS